MGVAACQLFYFNAVEHLSVSVALLLEYLGTVLVVVLAVAAARPAPTPADGDRRRGLGARPGIRPRPDRLAPPRPDRGAVGAGRRCRAGRLLRALLTRGRGGAAAGDGVGRSGRRRRSPSACSTPSARCTAGAIRRCPARTSRGQLARAGARPVGHRSGCRLHRRYRGVSSARCSIGLVRRSARSCLRSDLRLGAARSQVPTRDPVRRWRVDRRGCQSGARGRTEDAPGSQLLEVPATIAVDRWLRRRTGARRLRRLLWAVLCWRSPVRPRTSRQTSAAGQACSATLTACASVRHRCTPRFLGAWIRLAWSYDLSSAPEAARQPGDLRWTGLAGGAVRWRPRCSPRSQIMRRAARTAHSISARRAAPALSARWAGCISPWHSLAAEVEAAGQHLRPSRPGSSSTRPCCVDRAAGRLLRRRRTECSSGQRPTAARTTPAPTSLAWTSVGSDLASGLPAWRGARRGAVPDRCEPAGSAQLQCADLIGADLRAADLRAADLTDALYVTQAQLNSAHGDAQTPVLPGQRSGSPRTLALTVKCCRVAG